MQTGDLVVPSDNTRRRNIYLALALVFIATSCMFIFGLKGMIWLMWRDQPIAAAILAALGLFFAYKWFKTPR